MAGALARVSEPLRNALGVRSGEGRRTGLLFLQLLFASAVFVLGRTVRDTLFLSRYSLSALPWMFVLYGLASAITVVVYSRLADRASRHASTLAWAVVCGGSYVLTWLLVRSGTASWIYPVFYVWAEIVSNVFLVQFWTLANELHDPRSAKRLFGTIGAARTLGIVLVGLSTAAVVRLIGTAQLLLVLVVLMAGIAAAAWMLRNEPRAPQPRVRMSRRGAGRGPWADPYVRSLALLLLLTFVALTVGDYQFKAIARASYQEDALAGFFSLFYAGTGLLSVVFQLAVTPRVLARFGVGWALTVMPGVFGAASAALLGWPHLAVATVMKFADNGFQYTIHETTLQSLYVPFAAALKARTRALLDAIVKPLAYGAGGAVLIVLAPRLSVERLSLVTVPVVLLWLGVVVLVRRRYLRALGATLDARGVLALSQQTPADAGARDALRGALEQGEPRQLLVALDGLPASLAGELLPTIAGLVLHPHKELRVAALERLASQPEAPRAVVRVALGDDEPEVRAAALLAWAELERDDAVPELERALDDSSSFVQEAALTGLLRHAALAGVLVGGRRLEALLGSSEISQRVQAARVLGRLGAQAYRPLRELLADPSPRARRAALKAAAGVADPRLIPSLLERLEQVDTRQPAAHALLAIGSEVLPPLLELLRDPSTPRSLRLELPRMIKRLRVPEAYLGLRQLAQDDDSHVRLRIYAALSSLRRSLGRRPESLELLRDWLGRELKEAHANWLGWQVLRPDHLTPLLDEEYQFRWRRAQKRILRLLELRYPREPLRLVNERLRDPERRANALEMLDTVLEARLRREVLRCFDELPEEARRAEARALGVKPQDPLTTLLQQCQHRNPYVAMLALDTLRTRAPGAALDPAEVALGHPEPVVREAGLRVLEDRLPATAERIASLCEDPDPMVARRARAASAQPGTSPQEASMLTTSEKILFLRSAPMFKGVSGEDLLPLARLADEEHVEQGQRIVQAGEIGDALYVVMNGRVAIEHAGRRLAELGPGEAFGEMAVLDAEPRSADVVAASDCELLRIGSDEFYEALEEQVELAAGVIRTLTERLRAANAALERATQRDRAES